MDEQRIHELAIAYAQVKLLNYQEELKKLPDYNPFMADSEEVREYAKAYKFALLNFEHEYDSLD